MTYPRPRLLLEVEIDWDWQRQGKYVTISDEALDSFHDALHNFTSQLIDALATGELPNEMGDELLPAEPDVKDCTVLVSESMRPYAVRKARKEVAELRWKLEREQETP